MKLNKFIIATLLVMCVIGFSMSGVSAKEKTYVNTMEVGKPYYVSNYGGALPINGSFLNPGINMYWDNLGVNPDQLTGNSERCILRQCYNCQDLRDDGIVKLDFYPGSIATYVLTPLKVGEFDTKTRHPTVGDRKYHWVFV